MTNPIHPKKLLGSKWTKVKVTQKLKHFTVIDVEYDECQAVLKCIMRAEMNKQEFAIEWRELKNAHVWHMGWQ